MGINITEIGQKVLDNNTNAANVFRKMYDLHFNPNPLDVSLEYIDENGNKVTTDVPNRSKIKNDFDSWKGSVDKSIVFKVEGDNTKFYPVIVTTGYQPFRFTISRDSVHWDSSWYGRCMYMIEGFTSHYGNGANYSKIVINKNLNQKFLARIYEEHELGWIVLYLRGNTSYRFRTFFNNCNLSDYSTNVKSYTYGDNTVTFDIVNDGATTTYLDILNGDFVFDFTKDIPVKTQTSGTINTDIQ